MSCAGRTLDGERCTRAGDPFCPIHAAVAPPEPSPTALAADGRLARARELTTVLGERDAIVAERRELIASLRADGYSMAAIADALGISRTRLYAVMGPSSAS